SYQEKPREPPSRCHVGSPILVPNSRARKRFPAPTVVSAFPARRKAARVAVGSTRALRILAGEVKGARAHPSHAGPCYRGSLMDHYKLFTGGELVDGAAGETFETIDPGSGQPIATVARASETDANAAVEAARAAFDSGVWSRKTPL